MALGDQGHPQPDRRPGSRNGGGPVMALGAPRYPPGSASPNRRNGGGPVMALGDAGNAWILENQRKAAMEEGR